ncbi:MAG TPA: hypothetical protein VG479_00260 [Gaiellaceae bacterium]|nr:hypothetical protein [Gaiellaceae bacterium]
MSQTLESAFRTVVAVILVLVATAAPAQGAVPASTWPVGGVGDSRGWREAPAVEAQTDDEGVESSVTVTESEELSRTTVPSSMRSAVAGSSCKWVKGTVTYKSVLGFVLYKYWEKQSFCYNGAKITALWDYSRGPAKIDATWDWIGHVGLWRTGGVGTGGASVKTQGHFKQCLNIPFVTCKHRYPWVRIGMDNSGAVQVTGHN